MTKLRISIVQYLNTAPLVWGFTNGPLRGKYDFSFTVPSQCAQQLRIGDAASVVSAIPSVREALISFQRQFAADPPGAVLDGRDIGTVICPNADVKIFVVADPQVRAHRRTLEALARGEAADEAMVLADILKRDERDKNRAAAPLKAAADAHILDNSNLDIEGGVRAAIAIVEAVRAGR